MRPEQIPNEYEQDQGRLLSPIKFSIISPLTVPLEARRDGIHLKDIKLPKPDETPKRHVMEILTDAYELMMLTRLLKQGEVTFAQTCQDMREKYGPDVLKITGCLERCAQKYITLSKQAEGVASLG